MNPGLVLVFVGGALGTLGRYGIDESLTTTGAWPWSTFTVNVVGSLLLGLLAGRIADPADPRRLALGTGFLGGFTTYSAFAVQAESLLRGDGIAIAMAYVLTSVVAGITAAVIGLTAADRRSG